MEGTRTKPHLKKRKMTLKVNTTKERGVWRRPLKAKRMRTMLTGPNPVSQLKGWGLKDLFHFIQLVKLFIHFYVVIS